MKCGLLVIYYFYSAEGFGCRGLTKIDIITHKNMSEFKTACDQQPVKSFN